MTRIVLTSDQERELRRYESGEPVKSAQRPSRNLIRRDLLRLAPERGHGFYRITHVGAAALTERKAHVPDTVSERGFARNLCDAPADTWAEYVAVVVVCRLLQAHAQPEGR